MDFAAETITNVDEAQKAKDELETAKESWENCPAAYSEQGRGVLARIKLKQKIAKRKEEEKRRYAETEEGKEASRIEAEKKAAEQAKLAAETAKKIAAKAAEENKTEAEKAAGTHPMLSHRKILSFTACATDISRLAATQYEAEKSSF